MNLSSWKDIRFGLSAVCLCLSAGTTVVAAANASQIANGQKAKVKGVIISRSGDTVKIQDKKSGAVEFIKFADNTRIEHDKAFFRHTAMNGTALVPGLTIEANGIGNADGQLEATRITFSPDLFAVEVAENQQIQTNVAAVSKAQTTADQGVTLAATAQTSADKAQSTAEQGLSTAQAAVAKAVANAAAVNTVNQRVTDLGDYTTMTVAQVYFPENGSALIATGKADLDQLVSSASTISGYLIEIAGYTSSTGSATYNQKLSEERAASVVRYLIQCGNVPVRQIVVPVGYGETHAVAENTDRKGRALNRRVEVRVLVNKGLQETSQLAADSF